MLPHTPGGLPSQTSMGSTPFMHYLRCLAVLCKTDVQPDWEWCQGQPHLSKRHPMVAPRLRQCSHLPAEDPQLTELVFRSEVGSTLQRLPQARFTPGPGHDLAGAAQQCMLDASLYCL